MSPLVVSLRIGTCLIVRHLVGHMQGQNATTHCPLTRAYQNVSENKVRMAGDVESGPMYAGVSVHSTVYLPKTHVSKLNIFNNTLETPSCQYPQCPN